MHRENRPPCRNSGADASHFACSRHPIRMAPSIRHNRVGNRTHSKAGIPPSSLRAFVMSKHFGADTAACRRESNADYRRARNPVNASSTRVSTLPLLRIGILPPRQQENPAQPGKDRDSAQKRAAARPIRSGTDFGALPPGKLHGRPSAAQAAAQHKSGGNQCPTDEEATAGDVACRASL